MADKRSLAVVIVLYNQSLYQSNAYRSLAVQLKKSHPFDLSFYIYDNSPEPQNISSTGVSCIYVHDSRNSGLSRAYNRGAGWAAGKGTEWILLLDQDTTLPADALQQYGESVERHPSVKIFAPRVQITASQIYLSPARYRMHRIVPSRRAYSGKQSLHEIGVINSGLMIQVKEMLACGGYNEDVYLDFSDFQFIERFKQIHSDICIVNVTFIQEFSGVEKQKTKLESRYVHYCRCASHCEKQTLLDSLQYFILVFGRALVLSLRFKTLSFIRIFYQNYI